jgi:2-keto-3-deoxy-L-rhamnonate aldolase RhmA
VPQVESLEKAKAAVRSSKCLPAVSAARAGQYGALWSNDYRQTANDNMGVVVMIESPAGGRIADTIASVPDVDVVFAASTDLGSCSGFRQGDPQYEALVAAIQDATRAAGRSRAARSDLHAE